MMFITDVLLLITLLFPRFLLAISCYHPNGERVTDPSVQSCSRDANAVSMCCSLNRSSFPDVCLSNGLCGGGGNVFRDSCTDPTWKSPACLQLCTVGSGVSGTAIGVTQDVTLNYSSSDIQITDCNDGSYCCGPKNTTCCSRGHGKRIASILELAISTSSSRITSSSNTVTTSNTATTSATSPVTSTNDSTATAAAATSNRHSSGLDKKATIGIAVSCSIVAVVIAGAVARYFFVRKRAASPIVAEAEGTNPSELMAKSPVHEMPVPYSRTELWDREPHAELHGAATAELSG